MDLKGSKTLANLMTAFAGESQARNKYTYYASQAKKEGYEQIAAIFTETANNEKEHAKIWFKLIHDGVGTTAENLQDAAEGENYEWTDMYAPSRKKLRKRALPRSLTSLKLSLRLRKSTRPVTASCWTMSIRAKSSRKTRLSFGSAPTAAMYMKVLRLLYVYLLCAHPRSFFQVRALIINWNPSLCRKRTHLMRCVLFN